MRILSFALLAGALSFTHPALAQTATEQTASPAAPTASEPSPGSTAPTGVTSEPAPTEQRAVSTLKVEKLHGQDGGDLGNITRVVENPAEKKAYLVVSRGGLLGFFRTDYLVPVEQVAITVEGAIATSMTPTQIEGSPTVEDVTHQPLDDSQMVEIPRQR